MTILLFISSLIFAIGFFLWFFRSLLQDLLTNKRYLYIYVLLIFTSSLFLYKTISTAVLTFNQSNVKLYQAQQDAVLTQNTSSIYQDVFYSTNGKNALIFAYDGIENKEKVQIIDIQSKKLLKINNVSNFNFETTESSPFVRVNQKQNTFFSSPSFGNTRITSNKNTFDIPNIEFLNGNEFTSDGKLLYYTKKNNNFLSINSINMDTKEEKLVSKASERMFFNPYYWQTQKTLIYMSISKNGSEYRTNLVIQKEKDDALEKYLYSSPELSLTPQKISGNQGNLLAIADGKTPNLHFINMENYPFILNEKDKADIEFSQYKYEFSATLAGISSVTSISFHPTDPNTFLVLAIPDGRVIPQLYQYHLVISNLYKYKITLWDDIIALLCLIIFFSFGFIYRYIRGIVPLK